MKFLKPRETLLQNMAFMGIISAIIIIFNAIISVGDMFIPILGLVFSLVLPVLVVLVEVSCKDRYYPIFFSVTILLSLITCLWNVQATFYYLIPSLISGYIFGLFIKKGFPLVYGLFIASVLQGGLIYGLSRLVVVFFQIDSIEIFLSILKLSESEAARIIVPSTFLVLGITEMAFVALVISFEIKRFNLSFKDNIENEIYINLIIILFSVVEMILYFFNLYIAYIFMMGAIYFAIFLFANSIKSRQIVKIIVYSVEIVLTILLFVLCNGYLKQNGGFLLIGVAPLIMCFTNLIFNMLNKKQF